MGQQYSSRVDANQPAIVAALRSVGATVQHLHTVGHGCPDLLVGRSGATYLLEVKSDKGKLTPQEQEWHDTWGGKPVSIVRTIEEGIRAIGLYVTQRQEGKLICES